MLDKPHADTTGPFPPDVRNNRWLVMIVDHLSIFSYPIVEQKKHQIAVSLLNLIVKMENLARRSVRCIRTAHGTEFVNHRLYDFPVTRGIPQEKSVRYRPAENGRVK